MKYVLAFLIFMLHLYYNIAVPKEKPKVEVVHDPFSAFYPHLGDSICRKKAFEICYDNSIEKATKIKLWENHKETCSSNGSYQLILADMYVARGYPDKSIEILKQSIHNSEKYDTRYHKLLLHTIYHFLGEQYKALELANKIITEYKHWYGGYQALGADSLYMKDYCNAKKYLEKSLKLNDKDTETYLLLAAASYGLKEDDKVIVYYSKAFELDPIQPLADLRSSAAAVGVHVQRGQFEEAKNILDLQQEFFPELKTDKKFNAVKEYYEKALEKANKHDSDQNCNN
jgi:tetratricopeptide (TPR) repeat protein